MRSSAFQVYAQNARPTWGDRNRSKCDEMADLITIEGGIPIPPPRARNKLNILGVASAMRRMNKGDSIFLITTQNNASAAADRVLGAGNYVTRVWNEGVRIWRTK